MLNKCYQFYRQFLHDFALFIFGLRYNIKTIGIESLKNRDPQIGTLFLSNHSSNIDPVFTVYCLSKSQLSERDKDLSIWSVDFVFNLPYLKLAVKDISHVRLMKVPNISEKRSAKHRRLLTKLFRRTVDGLHKQKNYLIFPSGHSKRIPKEELRGASAVYHILRQCPNANIVLVKLVGLWGSRFSWAAKREMHWKNESQRWHGLWWSVVKMLVLNFVFFIPRRKVTVEFVTNPSDFPRFGSRHEMNRYLEAFYNQDWGEEGEPLYIVPNYFWKNAYIQYEYSTIHYSFNLKLVSKKIQHEVIRVIANKARVDPASIRLDMELQGDLGLDSLEITELLIEFEDRFKIKKLVPNQIPTVGLLIAHISHIPIRKKIVKSEFNVIRKQDPYLLSLSRNVFNRIRQVLSKMVAFKKDKLKKE